MIGVFKHVHTVQSALAIYCHSRRILVYLYLGGTSTIRRLISPRYTRSRAWIMYS